MSITIRACLVLLLFALPVTGSWAGNYEDTIKVFRNAGESGNFFKKSHGYAVFPTIAKGGIGIGGAHGSGKVYEKGKFVGDTSMTQVTIGLQLGGQNDANTVGRYHKGMAVFTVAKGGLMYEASIGGQKDTYQAK